MTARGRAHLTVLLLGCAAVAIVALLLLGAFGASRSEPSPMVVEHGLRSRHLALGVPVEERITLSASRTFSARAVGVAVRAASGREQWLPGAAADVRLSKRAYSLRAGPLELAAGRYAVFAFWRSRAGVQHDLPARVLTVGGAGTAGASPAGVSAAASPLGIPGTWTLKLDDEFNGSALDTAIWRAGWFGSGVSGPVNAEERACYRSSNVTVAGGSLRLQVTATPSTCSGATRPYSGALISSNPSDGRASGGFQYTYGVVQVRMYLPMAGRLIANWPALWSDGQDWPADGESDVLEGLSGHACFNVHSSASRGPTCVPGSFGGWHTFASDWEPGSITYYYDGVRVGRVAASLSAPMYLLLAYTVAPAIFGPSAPATMQVDYVKVWQH